MKVFLVCLTTELGREEDHGVFAEIFLARHKLLFFCLLFVGQLGMLSRLYPVRRQSPPFPLQPWCSVRSMHLHLAVQPSQQT